MKKFVSITLVLLFITSACYARPKVVQLCNEPWPPISLGKMGSESTGGYSTAVVREVFKRMDIKVEQPIRPWTQCLKLVEHGKMDGLATCIYSKGRSHYVDVTDPWVIAKGVWYYMDSKFPNGFEWNSYDDFKGYKVVGVRGSAYGEEFFEAAEKGIFKFHKVKNDSLAIKQLAAGIQDFYLNFNLVGDYMLQQKGLGEKFRSPKKPLYTNSQRFCISKKSPLHKLIPEINARLSDLKAEGFIDNIMSVKP